MSPQSHIWPLQLTNLSIAIRAWQFLTKSMMSFIFAIGNSNFSSDWNENLISGAISDRIVQLITTDFAWDHFELNLAKVLEKCLREASPPVSWFLFTNMCQNLLTYLFSHKEREYWSVRSKLSDLVVNHTKHHKLSKSK